MGTSSGRKAKLLAAFSLVAAFASVGEEPPRVKSSVDLTLTNVDVVVTDRNGKHVEGLLAADFDVMQDGRPMVVTNFQEMRPDAPTRPALPPPVSAEAPPPAMPTASAPAAVPAEVRRPPRTVVVFVDRLRLPDANLRRDFFTSIGNLLRRVMGPGDRTMIVAWDRTVQSVTPFTSDLPTLEASLRRLEKASAGIPLEEATLDQLSQQAAWYAGNASRGGSGNTGLTSRLLASQAFYEMQRKTAVLRGLTATLGGIEGKKILVLATHRFSRYAGLEFFLGKRALVSDPIGGDAHSFDTRELLETVVESANAHGVTFYGLYPAGRTDRMASAADPISDNPGLQDAMTGGREDLVVNNEAEALELVADKTGGLVGVGTTDIAKTLSNAAEDLESYYSIAYEAPFNRPDRPVSISVKVKGRKDLVVRARRGILEKSDAGRMKDRVLSNVFVPDASARIGITFTVRPADKNATNKRLDLQIQIPIGQLVLVPDEKGESGAISVFVAAAGPKGELSEVTQKRRDFRIPKSELEKAKGSFYTYEMTVETSGPGSILSVGVLDEVAKEAGFGRLLIPEPSAEAKKAKANPPRPDADPFSRRTRSRFAP